MHSKVILYSYFMLQQLVILDLNNKDTKKYTISYYIYEIIFVKMLFLAKYLSCEIQISIQKPAFFASFYALLSYRNLFRYLHKN